MKNNLRILAALALCLPWVGCNKPKTEWGQPPSKNAAGPPSGPVELKLKWPLGGHLIQAIDVDEQMEIPIPNNPIKQQMNMAQRFDLSVLKERPGSGPEVELAFLSLRMQVKFGGRTQVDFDSTKKTAPKNGKDPSAIFSKLAGSRIQYLLDASNQVESVLGVDALQQKLKPAGKRDTTGMTSMFNEDSLKQYMEVGRALPQKPVQPGDTWPVQREFAMGPMGTVVANTTYTFKDWETHDERNCAHFTFEGALASKDDPNPNSPNGVTMGDGKTSGECWFDPDRGLMLETSVAETMQMTFPAGPAAAVGSPAATMTAPMTIKVAQKLESAQ